MARTTAIRNPRVVRGRHPMLKDKSLAHRIFVMLKGVQTAARVEEIAYVLFEPQKVVRSMLGKMDKEGLVRQVYILNDVGIQVDAWLPNKPAEMGVRRDRVEIESVITVNDEGEYGVKSRIVGGLVTAYGEHPVPIHVVRQTVSIPKYEELGRKRVNPFDLADAKKLDPIVIEGKVEDTTPR